MKRIASGSQAAAAPASYGADSGTPGYFQDAATTPSGAPTQLTPKWCNMVQEAIVQTIENSGRTPDDTTYQFSVAVGGAHAVKAHGTSASGTTDMRRALVASSTAIASGTDSAVIASSIAQATASESAVVASTGDGLGLICEATGANSFVAAAKGSALASGAYSAVVGSAYSTATADGAVVIGGESHNATAANAGVFGGSNHEATAARAVCVGGDTNAATETDAACVGGSSNNATAENSGVFAGYNHDASGARAVCVGGDANNASDRDAATLGGSGNNASGAYSAAVGGATNTASGSSSACVGGGTSTASGQGAATVGAYASTASGIYSGALACDDVLAAGDHSAAVGCKSGALTTAADGSVLLASENVKLITPLAVAGGYSASATTGTASNQNLTWKIKSSDGSMIINSTLTQSGDANADYAEMFPNAERGVIPPGTLLARSGRAVRAARPGERVIGVVSAAPAVLAGGTGELGWAKMNATDEWGRVIFDQVEIKGADGVVKCNVAVPRVSADYDPTREHVPRTSRPDEWTPVALVGQVRVRIGAGVKVDDLLVPGPDGCAVASASPLGRSVEAMEIVQPYDEGKGYGVALCLVG